MYSDFRQREGLDENGGGGRLCILRPEA